MIFIQLIALMVIAFANYNYEHKNFYSPSVLLSCVGCVCTAFCIINYKNWNMSEYGIYTVVIVILAVISFSLASHVTSKISISKRKNFVKSYNQIVVQKSKIISYEIPTWFTLLVSIVIGINTYQYFKQVIYIAGVARSMYSVKTYDMLWYFKNVDTGLSVDFITSNLTDIGYAFSYLYLFFFLYNVISTKRIIKYLPYCIPCAIYAVQSVLFGGRTGLLQMITLMVVLIFYFMSSIYNIKLSNIMKKYMKKILIIVFVGLFVFVLLNNISGRSQSNMSFFYYISVYIGSGLKNFDTFLKSFNRSFVNKSFGWETFGGIYTFLNRFMDIDYDGLVLEFQPRLNNLFMGNVYTALRRYYYDFEILGIIVLPAFSGTVISFSEKQARKAISQLNIKSKAIDEAKCIIYGILVYAVVLFFIEDFFYINVMSVNYILKIIEILFGNWILIKTKIVKRIGRSNK